MKKYIELIEKFNRGFRIFLKAKNGKWLPSGAELDSEGYMETKNPLWNFENFEYKAMPPKINEWYLLWDDKEGKARVRLAKIIGFDERFEDGLDFEAHTGEWFNHCKLCDFEVPKQINDLYFGAENNE